MDYESLRPYCYTIRQNEILDALVETEGFIVRTFTISHNHDTSRT